MKTSLYPRLALDGMKKNRRLYLPYLMTCVLMAAVYYILLFLSESPLLQEMRGGGETAFVLRLGTFVIAIFSAIFLLYTNSFLIRRRKKEFGLYNVLGMTKGNLARILLWETVFCYGITMAAGLGFGVGLSKLAELGLLNLIELETDYSFSLSPGSMGTTALYFAAIFALICLNGLRQVRFSGTIDLVRSENMGEKPPKANRVLGVLGVLILGGAYALALSLQQPLEALMFFFVAVIMVIIGTYLLFIAGSVLLCRILQRKKDFYYKAKNFVSVSSMAYRMKRNGAGLASICILLTMVLVMLSSSACLYFGKDVALSAQYPRDICAFGSWYGYSEGNNAMAEELNTLVSDAVTEQGIAIKSLRDYDEYSISGLLERSHVGVVLNSLSDLSFIKYNKIAEVHFINLADYNQLYGRDVQLAPYEAVVCAVKTNDVQGAGGTFSVENLTFRITERIDAAALSFDGASMASVTANVFLIVDDVDTYVSQLQHLTDYDGTPMLLLRWFCQFDTDASLEQQLAMADAVEGYVGSRITWDESVDTDTVTFYVSCHDAEKSDFLTTFGGLFFIGIVLSLVFLVAAALIIYYKQLSEGYEDQARFDIMQKVGMTKPDIRRSINAQMLTVFLLPIGLAAVHMAFAFPVVQKLLMLFAVFHTPLLVTTTAISAAVCAAFYVVVYRITTNAYYSIVTGARE